MTMFIYRGLPGSGKTTQAIVEQRLRGGILAGRDHIRVELGITGGVGTPEEESEVTRLQTIRIREGLQKNLPVFVDDMNLRERYVKRLVSLAKGHKVEICDLRNVPLQDCIDRDLARKQTGGHYVGAERITELHRRYILNLNGGNKVDKQAEKLAYFARVEPAQFPLEGQGAVIVDVDGTVALKSPLRGFHDYDDRVSLDLRNHDVVKVVRGMISLGYKPIFLSGRMDSCAEATRLWLQRHVYAGDFDLYMRKTGDTRPDYMIKNEIFDQYINGVYNIAACFDDRNQVVELWRAKGLTCLQVAEGDF